MPHLSKTAFHRHLAAFGDHPIHWWFWKSLSWQPYVGLHKMTPNGQLLDWLIIGFTTFFPCISSSVFPIPPLYKEYNQLVFQIFPISSYQLSSYPYLTISNTSLSPCPTMYIQPYPTTPANHNLGPRLEQVTCKCHPCHVAGNGPEQDDCAKLVGRWFGWADYHWIISMHIQL